MEKKQIPIRPAHKVKYVFLKNWDAFFILGVIFLLGVALWKVFPSIEAKIFPRKDISDTLEHPDGASGKAESTTQNPEIMSFSDRLKSFIGISHVTSGKTVEDYRESQQEEDIITQDKIERLDETLKDIKDKLREDKELRGIP